MKIAIIGFGLMGSSLARAILRAQPKAEIIAIAHREETRQAALSLGLCQAAHAEISDIPQDCDWVVLAAPVSVNIKNLAELIAHIGPKTRLTDLGSTKEKIVAQFQKDHPDFTRFVPAHPMAGSEKSGIHAGRVDLYDGKLVILIDDIADKASLEAAKELFETVGADTKVMDMASRHDVYMSYISHLPHLLSFAFMNIADRRADPETELDYQDLTGGGFKDFSRIAASDPVMWRDILIENRENILSQLDEMMAVLDDYRSAMLENDGETLQNLIKHAHDERVRLMEKEEKDQSK